MQKKVSDVSISVNMMMRDISVVIRSALKA